MKIKVVVTEVWFVDTEEYTARQLQKDEYGSIGIDLAREIGNHQSTKIKYTEYKEVD